MKQLIYHFTTFLLLGCSPEKHSMMEVLNESCTLNELSVDSIMAFAHKYESLEISNKEIEYNIDVALKYARLREENKILRDALVGSGDMLSLLAFQKHNDTHAWTKKRISQTRRRRFLYALAFFDMDYYMESN